jgi:hypothetical protein
MDTKARLTKAIAFFRTFSSKADKDLYKKSVLKFCDLVEEYLLRENSDNQIEMAQKIFKE